MSVRKDLTGLTFGRLFVLGFEGHNNRGQSLWRCVCQCGIEKLVYGNILKNKKTLSCGCLKSETSSKLNTIHGGYGTRLYRIWADMIQRCKNSKSRLWKYYGGRGITVYEDWGNFEPFRNWALANGYQDDLTIDRIDVNGNYEPSNCRWANKKEQTRNRRISRVINGRTIAEWAELTGIDYYTFRMRLKKGWTFEKAINTPVKKYTKKSKS